MKKTIIILGISALLIIAFPHFTFAQSGMMGNYYDANSSDSGSITQIEQKNQQTLQNMTNDLLKSQNVTSVSQINCAKIASDELVKLGDAWMDVEIPNQQAHQAMDNMLGGDGSQSLDAAHTQMALRYLGCNLNENGYNGGYSWMPMMFGGYNNNAGNNPENNNTDATRGGEFGTMMGWGGYGYGYGNMMNGGFGWGFAALGVIFWLVAFIDLILLGIFLWKKIKSHK